MTATGQENLLPLTAEYAPPIGADDQGGYRINAPGVEQLAFVWLRNRYLMPGDVKGSASGEQFGSDDAERYARAFVAAPELLASLREVLGWYVEGGHAVPRIYIDRANAALAKAEGRS